MNGLYCERLGERVFDEWDLKDSCEQKQLMRLHFNQLCLNSPQAVFAALSKEILEGSEYKACHPKSPDIQAKGSRRCGERKQWLQIRNDLIDEVCY